MSVFVLDARKRPLMPCSEKRARHFVYELWVTGQDHPFYVGKATYETRPYAHLTQARRGDKSLKASIIRKADRNCLAIVVKRVFWSNSEDEIFAEEKRLIAYYGRRGIDDGGILANMTIGGDGRCGNAHTAESKAKISAANSGKVRSEQHRKALSDSLRGREVSEAKRMQISATLKGRPLSEAHKQKLSAAGTGRPCAEETRSKISEAQKGRRVSEERKRKISKTLQGRKKPETAADAGSKTKRSDAAAHVATQIESGMSQKIYCQAHGISEQTFCGWKRSPYVVGYLEEQGIAIPRRVTARSK